MGGRGSGGSNGRPAWLKIVEGNPGKRPVPPPLEVNGRLPPPPTYFNKSQKECWNEIVISLPAHVLKRADSSTVERCAVAWATYREAADGINRFGILVKTERGPRRNPLINVRFHAARELAVSANELGLNPLARSRMGAFNSISSDPMEMLLDSQDWANLLPSEDDLLSPDPEGASDNDAESETESKEPEATE